MTQRSEFINDFFNIYPTLTKFQKKVLKYLHWYAKKFRCVFPSIPTISQAIKCCIRTVMRCTSLFSKLGWIYKKKRGYCSNLYYMNDEIISLNLADESIFLRDKCHMNVTVLGSSSKEYIDISTKVGEVHIKKDIKKRPIPECVKLREISKIDQQRLADEFSEFRLVNAMSAAKKYHFKWGNHIKDLLSFVWKGAKLGWS
jgi:hypothetical protein